MRLLVSAPEVYVRLRKLMEDPNSTIEDFSKFFSNNPEVSSEILNTVNSPFFGFPCQIDNISRAIDLLGIGQVYEMILSDSVAGLQQIHCHPIRFPATGQCASENRWF